MTRIRAIKPEEANERVKAVFKDIERTWGKGKFSMLFAIHANIPEHMEAHWEKTKRLQLSDICPKKIKEGASAIASVIFGCEP